MKLNSRHALAAVAATGVLAGGVAGGVALASAGPAPASAATTATTATATTTPGPGWCDGLGGMHGVRAGQQPVLTAAADYLGLSQSQLLSQLQSGKSLADVATAQAKSVSGLKNAIIAAMTSRINASTRLSADQKAAAISEIKSHIDAMVNGTYPVGLGAHWAHSPMRGAGSPWAE